MKNVAALFCLFFLGTRALQAQSPVTGPAPTPAPAVAGAPNLDQRIPQLSAVSKTSAEYRLGPGDLIEITVFGVASFNQSLRISASGMIKLPLLDPIAAGGLTP